MRTIERSDEIDYELNLASDFSGNPLTEDTKRRLRKVVNHPTIKNWEDAHGIILNSAYLSGCTLWQSVIAVDPSFPRVGRQTDEKGHVLREWERVPDTDTLILAIKYASH